MSLIAALLSAGLLASSPLGGGFYDLGIWGVIGLAAFVALSVRVVVSRRPIVSGCAPAVGALFALAAVQFVSSRWGESAGAAILQGQQTLLYAAGLSLLILIAADRRGRVVLVAAGAVVGLVLNVFVGARLLASPLPNWFIDGRLYGPLGYVNGQAAAMLACFWPLIAAAERLRSWLAAAAALASAAFSLYLALMTQSRGGLAALVVSVVAMLAFVPRRRFRIVVLLPVVGGAAVAWAPLKHVYSSASPLTRLPSPHTVHSAVVAAALTALVAGALGGALLAVPALRELASRPLNPAGRVRRMALGGAAALVVVAIALAAGAPRAVDRGWREFKSLRPVPANARLASGGGNRYDYWRVALDEWKRDPLLGVGAGNYDRYYFLERRNDEDVRQPHSLFLQALAETGLVGFAALVAFVAAVLTAMLRALRRAQDELWDEWLVVAASGVFLLWALHASVDWLHLLPGITGLALCSAAVLVVLGAPASATRPRTWRPVRPLLFATLTIATASLGVLLLANRDRDQARAELARHPAAALAQARKSFEFDNQSVDTLYVIAAAQARLDRYDAARATLLRAAQLEPHNWVPLALLGDLATRRGDLSLAATAYREASALDPRNKDLIGLYTRIHARG